MALTLVLAESAIELVPNEIADHKTVLASARRKKKDPHRLILDQSYHHSAILKLGRSGIGRGRPDISHFSLLVALGSPLNIENKLRCYVHTRDDHLITISPRARLPRNTDRFTSLLEQLYEESVVPKSGTRLMTLKRESLHGLLKEISSDSVVALTTQGTPKLMESVSSDLADAKNPTVLIGGFPVGHFSKKTIQDSSSQYCIDRRPLEAWTVVARSVYDYEKAIGLDRF
ncbi:16S rRNA methyltransferase [Candidatus Bathyarchaeota archaeon]|nr:16S rRNA methyltransferase [Candidatus Bathyarchaeota archaeon]